MVETDLVDHAKQAFAWATASPANFAISLAVIVVSNSGHVSVTKQLPCSDDLIFSFADHTYLELLGLVWQAAAHVIPFLTRTSHLSVPGPLPAKFTDFWLIRQAMAGKRFETVHDLHKKHGASVYALTSEICCSLMLIGLLVTVMQANLFALLRTMFLLPTTMCSIMSMATVRERSSQSTTMVSLHLKGDLP